MQPKQYKNLSAGYEEKTKLQNLEAWRQTRLIANTISNMAGRQVKEVKSPQSWLPLPGDTLLVVKIPTKAEVMERCKNLIN